MAGPPHRRQPGRAATPRPGSSSWPRTLRRSRRWLVKTATTVEGRASLDRAVAVHAAVSHPTIVRPTWTIHGTAGPTLVYPWYDGTVLNHATAHGTDRSALTRFQRLPVPQVEVALDAILDAHLAVSAAGLVAVDLYDGCFLYDFAADVALPAAPAVGQCRQFRPPP
ncbi:hypothetical protein AB0B94_01060 [Micromonospora sp. NPDC048986]|uniref:hypothetical protein n=1 Tax=Micromonospora sp. NPDC048986 TaxID=3155644 RepID=UPI0034040B18